MLLFVNGNIMEKYLCLVKWLMVNVVAEFLKFDWQRGTVFTVLRIDAVLSNSRDIFEIFELDTFENIIFY